MLGFSISIRAQFSHPIVIMSGHIYSNEDTNKFVSAKVSIREIGDTAREITCSTSNKETGKYLVILKSNKKYWVHLEGNSIFPKDEMIETPIIDKTQPFKKDFEVIPYKE